MDKVRVKDNLKNQLVSKKWQKQLKEKLIKLEILEKNEAMIKKVKFLRGY